MVNTQEKSHVLEEDKSILKYTESVPRNKGLLSKGNDFIKYLYNLGERQYANSCPL